MGAFSYVSALPSALASALASRFLFEMAWETYSLFGMACATCLGCQFG